MIFVINLQQVEFDWVFRNMIRGLSMYNKRVGEKATKKPGRICQAFCYGWATTYFPTEMQYHRRGRA